MSVLFALGQKHFFVSFVFQTKVCLLPNSCSGGVCSARAEATSGWVSAQQQDSGALHEGGEELCPCWGAVQEGPGARADHRVKVRDAHIPVPSPTSHQTSKLTSKLVWLDQWKHWKQTAVRVFPKDYFFFIVKSFSIIHVYNLLWVTNPWCH